LTHLEGSEIYVDPQIESTASQWNSMEHIVGGAPLLIKEGKKIKDFCEEKISWSFRALRHARTAVGLLADGRWVFVVVDGKQPAYSVGMAIEELADFMENLGCVNALNLDGGGSTTFVYHD